MSRIAIVAVVLLLVSGCNRSASADPADGASPAPPRPSSSSGNPPRGFAFGHSSSGPGHLSMNVESRDGPVDAQLDPLLEKLTACYRASPFRDAHKAVRVSLHVTVSTSGSVTTGAHAMVGTLVDKGHGQQGYAFTGELSKIDKNDESISKCIDDAAKTATLVMPEASRGTSFGVTVDLSP